MPLCLKLLTKIQCIWKCERKTPITTSQIILTTVITRQRVINPFLTDDHISNIAIGISSLKARNTSNIVLNASLWRLNTPYEKRTATMRIITVDWWSKTHSTLPDIWVNYISIRNGKPFEESLDTLIDIDEVASIKCSW